MAEIDPQRWTATSIPEVARVLGVRDRTVSGYLARGCPGRPRCYPIPEIIEWCKQNVWKAGQTIPVDPEEAAMAEGGNSPALERWRQARAQMAELDLQQRQGALLRTEDVHQLLSMAALTYRNAGDQLVRRYGNEAADIINQAIEAMERQAERQWGEIMEATE